MKNVLVVTHDPVSPIGGGGGLRTVKTALEFKKRGYNVKIIAPSDLSLIDGVLVEQMPKVSKDRFVFDSLRFMMLLFVKLIFNLKYDTIFVHNSVAGIPCAVFSKLFFKSLVYDTTDIHTEYLRVHKNGLFIDFLRFFEYFSFRLAGRVIVVSKVMKGMLVDKGAKEERVFVVYDGCEADNFSASKEDRDYIGVIHHGGIDKQDGVPYIAEAAKIVVSAVDNVKFFIVGAGVELGEVKRIVDMNGLNDHFVFTGWKPYSEVKNYLRKGDIGLITRPDTLPNNTILTLKLLEYWASGTAVVSSRLKAIEEVSVEGEDIVFFKPGDSSDLASKIISLAKDKEMIGRLGANGRKKAETFDWDRLINRIVDISIGPESYN